MLAIFEVAVERISCDDLTGEECDVVEDAIPELYVLEIRIKIYPCKPNEDIIVSRVSGWRKKISPRLTNGLVVRAWDARVRDIVL